MGKGRIIYQVYATDRREKIRENFCLFLMMNVFHRMICLLNLTNKRKKKKERSPIFRIPTVTFHNICMHTPN
jgi:hypothetical protein